MERLSKIDKTFDSPSIISDLLKCSYNVNIYSEGWILKSFVRFNWIGLANVIVLYKIRSRLNHILWWFCVGHFWTKSPQTHTHFKYKMNISSELIAMPLSFEQKYKTEKLCFTLFDAKFIRLFVSQQIVRFLLLFVGLFSVKHDQRVSRGWITVIDKIRQTECKMFRSWFHGRISILLIRGGGALLRADPSLSHTQTVKCSICLGQLWFGLRVL